MNIVFFCTIDPSYSHTFFSTQTGPPYNCEWVLTSEEDKVKYTAAFVWRLSATKKIHQEVKEWVADNIVRWKEEKPAWFKIDKIPDDFLPQAELEAEGGAQRRRPSMFFSEMGFTTRRKKNSAENV